MDSSRTALERFTHETPEGVIAGWRAPRPDAPRLLFCHATGFCASAYKQMLTAAAETFDVTAVDLRGHGRTTLPADPARLRSWTIYARDVADFLDAHEGRNWTLAGHSMGAVVCALSARGRTDIAALRLIEPVSMPPIVRYLAITPLWRRGAMRHPPASLAVKRRADWSDRAAMIETYSRKRLFSQFAPGAIADYLEDGVREKDGGVTLSCAPAWEAATFTAQANDFWGAVRRAPAPMAVLAARDGSSTVFPGAGGRFRRSGAAFERIEGVTHLAPMERPDLAAAFLRHDAQKGV